MKDLNALRALLLDIKESGIHVGLPITKEECADLQVVIEEYLERYNLFWHVYRGRKQQILYRKNNGSNEECGEVCKLTSRFIETTKIDKKYRAWRLNKNILAKYEAPTESAYFDTKQEAIDWVVGFYKSNGYSISAGEQEKC